MSSEKHDRDGTPNLSAINARIRELRQTKRQSAMLFRKLDQDTELAVLEAIKEDEPSPEEIRETFLDWLEENQRVMMSGNIHETDIGMGEYSALKLALKECTPYDADDVVALKKGEVDVPITDETNDAEDSDSGSSGDADEWTDVDIE